MSYKISIPDKVGQYHSFYLYFYNGVSFKRIFVDDVCVIYIHKIHDHRYDLKAFFYESQRIYVHDFIRSKKELYDVVQELLQYELY